MTLEGRVPIHPLTDSATLPNRIIWSGEGIEIVHACFVGGQGNFPEEIQDAAGNAWSATNLVSQMLARPSSLSAATTVPVNEWLGE
jgi:hypothetical protein